MDPSVDQEWPVDEGLRGADRYVFVVTCLYLVPKVLVFHPVLMALQLPALLLARCRVWSFVAPTFKVDRSTCGHRAYVAAAFLLALPALLVVIVSYLLDMVAYYAFSILYCAATCKWKQYGDSCRALQPYRGGPTVCSMGDFFVCMLGATWRQGALEATFMLASMWSMIPWMKYFVHANPFVYPLEERFVQQISTSMQDVSLDDLTSGIDEIIVSTKGGAKLGMKLDAWPFAPHYPYPPPWRRYALGVQAAGSSGLARSFVLTHSTHLGCRHGGDMEPHIRSASCMRPWMRVMLWHNNPYHFFTAWVEANISTGAPSQLDKVRGGEHPMWIVTSHSPWHCSRSGWLTPSSVDAFFDSWLPKVVHAIRERVRGKEAADELQEEVVSKDGVSRPKSRKAVPHVPP